MEVVNINFIKCVIKNAQTKKKKPLEISTAISQYDRKKIWRNESP